MHLAELCSPRSSVLRRLEAGEVDRSFIPGCLMYLCIGCGLYGAAFGSFHSGTQAVIAAIKMPLLFVGTLVVSGTVNAMLAQVLGTGLRPRQTWACTLAALSVSGAILGALSPVVVFFLLSLPRADAARGDQYGLLLASMTALIAFAGILGMATLLRNLQQLAQAQPLRIFVLWIGTAGLTGCQLSWWISPFLARPELPVMLWNPDAFSGNFFEYLFRSLG